MPDRIWNARRKWAGNLIPILCVLPFGIVAAVFFIRAQGYSAPGMVMAIGDLVIGWLTVNAFGMIGNDQLKGLLQRKLLAKAAKNASAGIFVGFSRPSYRSALDAHEDLGFLFLESDRLEFVGEVHHVVLHRWEVKQIRYRWNIHTLLGLGRWVSVEGTMREKPFRLLVEPRRAATLLGNMRWTKELKGRLESWLAAK